MANCPSCSGDIDEDFGLTDCVHCGTPVFIEFDGTAKSAEADMDKIGATTEANNIQSAVNIPKPSEDDLLESLPDSEPQDGGVALEEFGAEQVEEYDYSTNPPEERTGELGPQYAALEMDIETGEAAIGTYDQVDGDNQHEMFDDLSNDVGQVGDDLNTELSSINAEADELPEEFTVEESLESQQEDRSDYYGTETKETLKDIADYGNSRESVAGEGLYHYTLKISGIDSKEIRSALRDTFTDERLKWEVNEVMGQIKNGQLIIDNLNPVKAAILINNIKYLPVELGWEQHDLVT